MYQTNNKNYSDAIAGPNRIFDVRFLCNDEVLVDSVKSFTKTAGSEEITIGSAISSYVQATIENVDVSLSGKEVTLEVGIEIDGEIEYVPMGVYTIQNPKKESNKTTFTAYDCLASKCNNAYFSELSYPVDALDVLDEIETKTGISINKTGLQRGIQISQRTVVDEDYNEETDVLITSYVNPFDGYTYKEAIGFIAGLYGRFAACGRTGKVEFLWYQDISYNIPSSIFYNDLQESEEAFSVGQLTCSNADQTISAGDGATGISIQNPIMTQDILNSVYNNVKGLTYTPVTLRFIGDPRLDVGDIVTAEKNDGTKIMIPIISLTTSYDGGLMQTIASYGSTVEEDDSDTKGPITEMAERVEYETALVKKLMAENFTATNATIKNLSGDVLNFKTGEFENLKSDIAIFKETTTTNLNATNAKIENLESNTIKTSELEAKIANIGYLKADEADIKYATIDRLESDYIKTSEIEAKVANIGYLKADEADIKYATVKRLEAESGKIDDLQSDYATFKTATADNLKAANANIENLTATKATITDLDVATASIGVLEGNYAHLTTLVNGNLTSANIQSLTLTSKNTTIANGMIKNAMIENLSFDKITGMDINTTNLTVHSSDGKSQWTDNTIQISDANRVRVQIGKDASNDYSMSVWDKNGNLIWDALGATDKTIQRKIIRDDVVADNANISGSKLDINSVIKEVNGSTTKLKSSVINMDDKNQTLDVVFNELATTVDEIEVGGRNLFYLKDWGSYYTGNASKCSVDINSGEISLTAASDDLYFGSIGWKAGDAWDKFQGPLMDVEESKYITYTISNELFTKNFYSWYDKDKKCIDAYHGAFKVSDTLEVPENAKYFVLRVGYGAGVAGETYKLKIKVEKGNKPTDWTPAPEDTESAIESNTTSINVMQGKIDTLLSTTKTLGDDYKTVTDNYNSISETVESHTQTIGSHTSSLDSVSSKISTIESNLSGITTRVSASEEKFDNLEIGGRNLLLNSAFKKDTTSWTNWGNPATRELVNADGKTWMHIVGNKQNYQGINQWTQKGSIKAGDQITFSVRVKGGSNNQRFSMGIHWMDSNNNILDQSWGYFIVGTTDSVCVWRTTARGTNCSKLNLMVGVSDTSAVYDVYFTELKLEKGNKATDYTPAPEDSEIDGQNLVSNLPANWEQGTVNQNVATGSDYSAIKYSSSLRIRPKELIPVSGNITISGVSTQNKNKKNLLLYYCLFDVNKKYLGTHISDWSVLPKIVDVGEARYMAIALSWEDNLAITPSDISNICLKIERGTSATPFTLAPTDVNGKIVNVESVATQTADQIGWLINKNGSTASSLKLTQNALTAIAENINLTGKVKFSSFSADAKQGILDSFEVGGRNLALNTSISYSTAFTSFSGVQNTCIDIGDVLTEGLSAGDTVTVYLYMKYTNIVANGNNLTKCWMQGYGNVTQWTGGDFTGSSGDKGVLQGFSGSGEYEYLYSFKISEAQLKNHHFICQLRVDYVASGSIQYKAFKVEKGNKATDWTPAPEDYLPQAGLVSDWTKNSTWIDGSKIYTGSITADKIDVANLFAQNIKATGTIEGVTLKGAKGEFTGKITAASGKIGKYEITDQWLITGSGSTATGIGGNQAFWAGGTDSNSSPFRVSYAGTLVAKGATLTDADVSGKITATSGDIGGWKISSKTLLTPEYNNGNGISLDSSSSTITTVSKGINQKNNSAFTRSINIGNASIQISSKDDYENSSIDITRYITMSRKFSDDNETSYIHVSPEEISIDRRQPWPEISDTAFKVISMTTINADRIESPVFRENGTDLINKYAAKSHYHWFIRGGEYSVGVGSTAKRLAVYNPDSSDVLSNKLSLGSGSALWTRVYAANATISTSDERLKENIQIQDERYEKLFDALQPVTYRWKGSDHDRIHTGFIAQQVKSAMDQANLTATEFAAFCYDDFTKDPEWNIDSTDGMSDRYSLAYEEFISLNTHMIQKTRKDMLYQAGRIDMQEAIINDLQFKIVKMEKKIEQLTKALA